MFFFLCSALVLPPPRPRQMAAIKEKEAQYCVLTRILKKYAWGAVLLVRDDDLAVGDTGLIS